ncbi:MAG: hypothetical protein DBY30_10045 [Verrucomicrobia bacterium]|nr:MAG: hypothetical protein DBY30_10045 [Verrucomicrobiota bacterium]
MRAGNGSAGIFARACSGRPRPASPLRNEKIRSGGVRSAPEKAPRPKASGARGKSRKKPPVRRAKFL